jgi:hypothetical protein
MQVILRGNVYEKPNLNKPLSIKLSQERFRRMSVHKLQIWFSRKEICGLAQLEH